MTTLFESVLEGWDELSTARNWMGLIATHAIAGISLLR